MIYLLNTFISTLMHLCQVKNNTQYSGNPPTCLCLLIRTPVLRLSEVQAASQLKKNYKYHSSSQKNTRGRRLKL